MARSHAACSSSSTGGSISWRLRKRPEERPGGRELVQVGGLIVPVGEYVPQFARRRVPVVAEVAGAYDKSTACRAE